MLEQKYTRDRIRAKNNLSRNTYEFIGIFTYMAIDVQRKFIYNTSSLASIHEICGLVNFDNQLTGVGMYHKRMQIRVPIIGEVVLSCRDGVIIHASTIDISAVGVGITNQSTLLKNVEYDVEILTADHEKINFKAVFVHESKAGVGLKIVEIDAINLKEIYSKILDFQKTEEFVDQIIEKDILRDWFLDDKGDEIDVTFQIV